MNPTVLTIGSPAATLARGNTPPPTLPEEFPGGMYGLKDGYEVGKISRYHIDGTKVEGTHVGCKENGSEDGVAVVGEKDIDGCALTGVKFGEDGRRDDGETDEEGTAEFE